MAFIMTRIDCGDYDAWKEMFDLDLPGVRKSALGWRLYRSVANPAEVFIQVEFASAEEAKTGRERLLAAGFSSVFPTGPGRRSSSKRRPSPAEPRTARTMPNRTWRATGSMERALLPGSFRSRPVSRILSG